MSDEEIEIDAEEIEETGDDEIMNEEGGEDAGGEGEGEGDENILENTYYSAKGSLEEDLEEALESFQTVLDMEEEKGEWGFKSLKQMIKALLKAQRYEELVKRYKQLLEYTTVVNKNDSEKAINKILNMTSNLQNQKVLDQLYTVTLDAMKSSKNEKLWFNVKSRQAQLFLTAKDYGRLGKVLAELKQVCALPDGSENPAKASSLLEVFVLEIQMYTEQNELKKLKALYEKCSKILSGGAVVLAPKTTAIIRECGGKMYMREKQWKQANEDFFEAFKSYDEAGNVRRINCLKYLVLANMLSNSDINPFDAPEAKPYKNHTEIVAMNNLVSAFQHANINQFEKILKENKQTIAEDSFIQEYLPDLLKGVRTKVLLQIIQPYTRIRMAFLAKELNITVPQVESLAVDLILDQQLDGHIDQMKEVIQLGGDKSAYSRYKALSDWSRRLQDIHTAVLNKVY